jgi:hypothetical protein
MARVRNYKAEYATRVGKGLAKGLTRSQARGHPEAGKALASGKALTASYDRQLEEGVKLIRGGLPMNTAAKSIHVAVERLRNYSVAQDVGQKEGSRWRIGTDIRKRVMLVFSKGEEHEIVVSGYQAAKLIGEYMSAVGQFLKDQNLKRLKPFKGVSVADVNGKQYIFETDPNTLYRLSGTSDRPYEKVYQIVR